MKTETKPVLKVGDCVIVQSEKYWHCNGLTGMLCPPKEAEGRILSTLDKPWWVVRHADGSIAKWRECDLLKVSEAQEQQRIAEIISPLLDIPSYQSYK
jgi:hypothetical protein